MKALIQWIQIGNWLSTSYRENASTDTATVVGGVSISALVFAALATLSQVKPDLGITADLIATVTAMVGATAAQVVPWIKHWFDARKAERQAAAKERVDGSEFAQRIAAEQAATPPVSLEPVDLSADKTCVAISYVGPSGKRRAALGKTLAQLVTVYEAVEVTLADGRTWKK